MPMASPFARLSGGGGVDLDWRPLSSSKNVSPPHPHLLSLLAHSSSRACAPPYLFNPKRNYTQMLASSPLSFSTTSSPLGRLLVIGARERGKGFSPPEWSPPMKKGISYENLLKSPLSPLGVASSEGLGHVYSGAAAAAAASAVASAAASSLSFSPLPSQDLVDGRSNNKICDDSFEVPNVLRLKDFSVYSGSEDGEDDGEGEKVIPPPPQHVYGMGKSFEYMQHQIFKSKESRNSEYFGSRPVRSQQLQKQEQQMRLKESEAATAKAEAAKAQAKAAKAKAKADEVEAKAREAAANAELQRQASEEAAARRAERKQMLAAQAEAQAEAQKQAARMAAEVAIRENQLFWGSGECEKPKQREGNHGLSKEYMSHPMNRAWKLSSGGRVYRFAWQLVLSSNSLHTISEGSCGYNWALQQRGKDKINGKALEMLVARNFYHMQYMLAEASGDEEKISLRLYANMRLLRAAGLQCRTSRCPWEPDLQPLFSTRKGRGTSESREPPPPLSNPILTVAGKKALEEVTAHSSDLRAMLSRFNVLYFTAVPSTEEMMKGFSEVVDSLSVEGLRAAGKNVDKWWLDGSAGEHEGVREGLLL